MRVLKCILFMPNLYLENGKRIETGRDRGLVYARNEFLRLRRVANGGLGEVSRLFVSLGRSRWEVEDDRHRYLGFGGRGLGTPVVS